MNIEIKFGEVINKHRLNNNLSLTELGKLSGLNRTTVSKIESGKLNPTLKTMNMLAKALEINLYQLIIEAKID